MTNAKKQLKLTKLFRKKGARRVPEDCEELQLEVQELEQKLKEKQNELFQLQRNSYRRKLSPPKKRSKPFTQPKKIVISNAIEKLKRDIELQSQLSGMDVQSYEAGDHCTIVYHMQHRSEHQVKHGIRINMKSSSGVSDIEKYSLPLGFNLAAVVDDFDSVKTPECLGAVRKALVTYYDRLEQFEALKRLLNMDAQLFKLMDSSHIEITFTLKRLTDEDDVIDVTLDLDYRVYDIRPKTYSLRESGNSELQDDTAEVIGAQCAVFKKKPLKMAFKEAFIDGCGPYQLVQQLSPTVETRRPRVARPAHGDDTFRPEDYPESDDDQFPDN